MKHQLKMALKSVKNKNFDETKIKDLPKSFDGIKDQLLK